MKKNFQLYTQFDAMDCGPTCLRMIAKYYGKSYSLETLREKSFISRLGVSMLGISDAAENVGFRTVCARTDFEQLAEKLPLPCILHWNQEHFVVCYGISKKRIFNANKESDFFIKIADPAGQKYILNKKEFLNCWLSGKSKGKDIGTVLVLEPTPKFYQKEDEKTEYKKTLSYFTGYLSPYKTQLFQIVLTIIIGSIISIISPFLVQAMIDQGIGNNNINFVTMILVAQLTIAITQTFVNLVKTWVVLHMNTRINIALISDFLGKLMRLPIRFFDTRHLGDLVQRIGDNSRIKSLLSGSFITIFFSIANFIIFASIMIFYNYRIFFIFMLGTSISVAWILSFMRFRRRLDHSRFTQSSTEKNNLYNMLTGMQEIKLCNCEKKQRWKWEKIQVNLFQISVRSVTLGQYQQIGNFFISQATSIFITYYTTMSVINGEISLGTLMSVSYILGMLSGSIGNVVGFLHEIQDAKISLERLNEIHNRKDEDQQLEGRLDYIPEDKTIKIENLYFNYDGSNRCYVLEDLNLVIPQNKVTAIVGASGSGKTTIVKLLLGFYEPLKGSIKIGETILHEINPHLWRMSTASVLQDSFIFSDTIANNIAPIDDQINKKNLLKSAKIANIQDFIESLPLKFNTKIGMEGTGVSQGQKQRLLIARSVYKNSDYMFFDEATNSLDANNERQIMDNLSEYFQGKTVVIVAHRLSTVQNADNIIVLDKGKVI
ncbi:MAG: peptidase domain-containing ABC transporter, partial [Bacteroidales bacterium]|nr:peptidase domain-containing ABC transporter [Bacteroidales bacterium]